MKIDIRMNVPFEFDHISLFDIQEVNSSFAKASLKVMYVGDNRNNSNIEKPVVQRALPTLYNVPIVAHWMIEENTIGGHDIEVVHDDHGIRFRNLTEPCGVVPDHAKFRFEVQEDEYGEKHEYLIIDGVLLWKRQDVYKHIVNDLNGKVKHSMEITVKSGKKNADTGRFVIDELEFTALCLLENCEPCFEGSELELYTAQNFKLQMEQMMQELKETFSMVTPSAEVHDTHPQNILTEGGEKVLHEKTELAARYGIDVNALDFSLDDFTLEELTEKFEAMQATAEEPEAAEPAAEPEATEEPETAEQAEPADPEPAEPEENPEPAAEPEADNFALTGNVLNEVMRSLEQETMTDDWGTWPRYCYADCDLDAGEVYCWDCTDWLLYGFKFAMDGDNVVIDFESKQRMKYVIAPFEEGEQASPFAETFQRMAEKLQSSAELNEKYQAASDTITAMETELGELRQFKADTESKALQSAREEVFAQFEDLIGVEAFEDLRAHCEDYSDMDALEEKCFAIRGRNGTPAKFSMGEKTPKLKVVRDEDNYTKEPYGGLFARFGIEAE